MSLMNLDYKFGIEEIDSQHGRILSIIDQIKNLLESIEYNIEEIDKVIQELVDYSFNHFGVEEWYFKEFNYDKTTEHIEIHNQYRDKLKEWRSKYDESKDKLILLDISKFLEDWWVWHINNTDRQYIELFKERGVK